MKKILFIFGMLLFFTISLFSRVSAVYGLEKNIVRASATLQQRDASETKEDTRIIKLEKYLETHNSPLLDSAEDFVVYADIYGFGDDWSMIAAIAGVESTFGKHIPQNSYNAWGWGIPTGTQSGIGFTDWTEGIEEVSKGIKQNYMDKGAVTLSQIGRIYAPPSNTWAGNVEFFMDEIESTSITPSLSL